MLKEILRTPYEGLGNPEELKYDMSGWWSRRINQEHRIIYRIIDNTVEVSKCRGHYYDR